MDHNVPLIVTYRIISFILEHSEHNMVSVGEFLYLRFFYGIFMQFLLNIFFYLIGFFWSVILNDITGDNTSNYSVSSGFLVD